MRKEDLILAPEEIYQVGQDYFESDNSVPHSQYTHNRASLKAAKAILEWIKNNALRGIYVARPDIQGWILSGYELNELESIIKDLENMKSFKKLAQPFSVK